MMGKGVKSILDLCMNTSQLEIHHRATLAVFFLISLDDEPTPFFLCPELQKKSAVCGAFSCCVSVNQFIKWT